MCIWPSLQNVIYTSDWMCERFAHSNRRRLAIFTKSILPDSNGMAIGLNCSRVLLFCSRERWRFAARRCSTRLCGLHRQRCDGLTSPRLAKQLLLPSIGIVCSKDRFIWLLFWRFFNIHIAIGAADLFGRNIPIPIIIQLYLLPLLHGPWVWDILQWLTIPKDSTLQLFYSFTNFYGFKSRTKIKYMMPHILCASRNASWC